MGILDRVSTILRANINALLDQAEDPEKTLDQLIRDMADAIGQARGQVAEMIAQEKLLEADMERNLNLARGWSEKAELAISRGADDLAKEALRRKLDYERNAHAYTSQLQSQQEVVAKLKHDLQQLERKYESAVRNREALIARRRRNHRRPANSPPLSAREGGELAAFLRRRVLPFPSREGAGG